MVDYEIMEEVKRYNEENKDFEIDVQETSYDLYQTRHPKQFHRVKYGEETVKVCHGYFTRFENCLEAIIRIDLSSRKEKVDLRSFLDLYICSSIFQLLLDNPIFNISGGRVV